MIRALARRRRSDQPALDWAGSDRWRLETALRRAAVPPRYIDATIDQVQCPAVGQYLSKLDGYVGRGSGLLLFGPVGTGKSCAAALVLAEAVKKGFSIGWSYVPDLLDSISEQARVRASLIRAQARVDVLVWDDFGVRTMAPWEIGWLDQVVEARHRLKNRPMIVTTNLTGEDLLGNEQLTRMVDRWRESNVTATISGASRRQPS